MIQSCFQNLILYFYLPISLRMLSHGKSSLIFNFLVASFQNISVQQESQSVIICLESPYLLTIWEKNILAICSSFTPIVVGTRVMSRVDLRKYLRGKTCVKLFNVLIEACEWNQTGWILQSEAMKGFWNMFKSILEIIWTRWCFQEGKANWKTW